VQQAVCIALINEQRRKCQVFNAKKVEIFL